MTAGVGVGGGGQVITRVVMPLTHTKIYIRDGLGPNCRPRGPVTQTPPVAGPVNALSFNVTPSLDINYILNDKISLQDQNSEFIENTVIPDHCINRCINRVKCE